MRIASPNPGFTGQVVGLSFVTGIYDGPTPTPAQRRYLRKAGYRTVADEPKVQEPEDPKPRGRGRKKATQESDG